MYTEYAPDFATPLSDSSREDERAKVTAQFCSEAFEVGMKAWFPALSAAREIDDDLLGPFRYCHRTWRDGAVALEQKLIELANRWKELGLAGSCPFTLPTTEALLVHEQELDKFETARDLNLQLAQLLKISPTGWVPAPIWEAKKAAHETAFRESLQIAESNQRSGEETLSPEELRILWPFDIPERIDEVVC